MDAFLCSRTLWLWRSLLVEATLAKLDNIGVFVLLRKNCSRLRVSLFWFNCSRGGTFNNIQSANLALSDLSFPLSMLLLFSLHSFRYLFFPLQLHFLSMLCHFYLFQALIVFSVFLFPNDFIILTLIELQFCHFHMFNNLFWKTMSQNFLPLNFFYNLKFILFFHIRFTSNPKCTPFILSTHSFSKHQKPKLSVNQQILWSKACWFLLTTNWN